MYCRYCGKPIDGDGNFCKHCGKNLYENNSKKKGLRWFEKIKSQPPKIQIVLIVYSIWFLIWVCILINNSSYSYFVKNGILPFFLFAIVCPFILLCIVYLFGMKKKYDNNKRCQQKYSEGKRMGPSDMSSNNSSTIIETQPLLDFAKQKGKMQIVRRSDQRRYCLFTSTSGETIVELSQNTYNLSAEEISTNKHFLCVNLLHNGIYELDYAKDKEQLKISSYR